MLDVYVHSFSWSPLAAVHDKPAMECPCYRYMIRYSFTFFLVINWFTFNPLGEKNWLRTVRAGVRDSSWTVGLLPHVQLFPSLLWSKACFLLWPAGSIFLRIHSCAAASCSFSCIARSWKLRGSLTACRGPRLTNSSIFYRCGNKNGRKLRYTFRCGQWIETWRAHQAHG